MDKVTQNPQEIRKWAETYGAAPQVIESPDAGAEKLGVRLRFSRAQEHTLFGHARSVRDSTWEEFFRILSEQNLAFVYSLSPNINNLPDSYKFVPADNL